MTLVSEALRIKSNIANAYASAENKGATLPEVQNSDNLAECIDSITGGGDVVYAINQSSSIPEDKVLVRQGKAGSNEFTSDIFSSKQYIEAKGWYDDNTIIGSFLNKENRRIRYVDDSWQEEVLETLKPVTASCSNFFWTTNNGRILSKNWYTNTYNSTDSREYFISDDGFTLVSNKPGAGYLGAYNGVHYGYVDKEADIYVYYPDTSSYASSSLINGPGKRVVSFLMGDKIFLLGGNNGRSYRFYQLQEDNSYTTLQSAGELSSSYGILKIFGATGLEVGDYLLALNDGDTTSTNPDSALYKITSNTTPQLVILQIQSDYTLVQVSIPGLEQFETVDCRISYDTRNEVLMVGTKLGVFAYQYESQTKTFKEMPINLGLPEISVGTVYWAYLSPNKKRILVTLPMSGVKNDAGDYAEKVWIYQLSESGEWFIVDNRTLNYQPRTVFTGYTTGNVDEDGKYEVNLGSLLVDDGGATKYGVSSADLLGDVDENGVLQFPTKECNLVMNGVKSVLANGLEYKFSNCRGITSVSIPDLEQLSTNKACYGAFRECRNMKSADLRNLKVISGGDACSYMFENCSAMETIDLSNLTTISGSSACRYMFIYGTKIKSINLSNLTTISGISACQYMFQYCRYVETVDFSNLATISGLYACNNMFQYCSYGLTTISFPKLQEIDSSALNNMFSSCNALKEIHFRADMQTTVEALTGYSSKFGASNATIYFDL